MLAAWLRVLPSTPWARTSCCMLRATSSVTSAVEPPAPQVMSQKQGPSAAMRICRSLRLCTPSSVLGGKYSKLKKDLPSAIFPFSLSMIFVMAACLPYGAWLRQEAAGCGSGVSGVWRGGCWQFGGLCRCCLVIPGAALPLTSQQACQCARWPGSQHTSYAQATLYSDALRTLR